MITTITTILYPVSLPCFQCNTVVKSVIVVIVVIVVNKSPVHK